MKTKLTLNTLQTKLIAELEEAGFGAKWWGRDSEPERVYFSSRRDKKIYLTFDEPETLRGVALRVWVADCGQHANWYKGQRRKSAQAHAEALEIAVALGEGNEEAERLAAKVAATPEAKRFDLVSG